MRCCCWLLPSCRVDLARRFLRRKQFARSSSSCSSASELRAACSQTVRWAPQRPILHPILQMEDISSRNPLCFAQK